jgi:glycosyltransferase involved in cell wall biosynthesis
VKILAVSNMYPTPEHPASGVFVEQQVVGLRALGVEVRVLLIDRRIEGALTYYRMGTKIRNAVMDFKPDVVHAMYGGVMAGQIARMTSLPPLVLTFHGADLYGENHSGFARKLVSHYGVRCSRGAARRADGIVVVAGFLMKFLPQEVERDRIRTIPCGIDLDRFKPIDQRECQVRLGWQPDRLNVLFVSGVGYGHKRPWLAKAAVNRAVALGLPARLHCLSGVPNSEVPVWVNASDVLILTSYDEASPTIVKEALACNVPVVSVDVGDVAERIHGIAGCHLTLSDSDSLAEGLRRVHEAGKRVAGRAAVEALSTTQVATQLREFYESVVGRKKTRNH